MPLSSSAAPEPAGEVVVTGVGIVSAAGAGHAACLEALDSGAPLARDTSPQGAPQPIRAAAIEGFSLRDYGAFRGTAEISRTAQLAAAATALAQREAATHSPIPRGDRVGVVLATAFGNLESMVRFDRGARREGHRFVDPMIFPNTVLNAAAGHVSILFGYSALNSTVSSGTAGGLQAIEYAADALRRGDADLVFAGGAEELSYWTWLGERELRGTAPFEEDAVFPGEGAAVLALERAADARARGAAALAVVAGHGESFAAPGFSAKETIAARVSAMRRALLASGCDPQELDCLWSGAVSGSRLEGDGGSALREIFGRGGIRVATVAPVMGDWRGASSAIETAAAVGFLEARRLPRTVVFLGGMEEGAVRSADGGTAPRTVMVCAFDPLGAGAALVLSLPEGVPPGVDRA
ncbi:MAG TPA: beta-ketoacyl synthase N-terminal-like domain-containing protein [Candidatus Dormibacteraeota bacterium]|nr:beta-ketoacyl synthase N-terminal-like domain-containing protein [Candidatus Dormibacteraeota bacterium]